MAAWLDAVVNAAMILTVMGPIAPISTPAAKVFHLLRSVQRSVLSNDGRRAARPALQLFCIDSIWI
jgi:hypothetical protein